MDIIAQTMNYSGATMAGPSIFAIVYSSVTIWCALFSRVMLKRKMTALQWIAIVIVFVGLCITGFASLDFGDEVAGGTLLIVFGSALHALMYVLSEVIMNTGKEVVSAKKYCAVYGSIACSGYFLWQTVYTRRHFAALILEPMQVAGTTYSHMVAILSAIALMSFIHSVTFFHTVKYVPGGSTSAGVLKALQAVLVFAATSMAFCNVFGGQEMCFTVHNGISLCIVVGGVVLFGKATSISAKNKGIHPEGDVELE